MNYPAASREVSKQHQLMIFIYLRICPTLTTYILHNHLLVTMFSHTTCKISACPKLSTPQLLLDLWTSTKYLSSSYALDYSDHLRHRFDGHTLHQKMNMVFIRSYL